MLSKFVFQNCSSFTRPVGLVNGSTANFRFLPSPKSERITISKSLAHFNNETKRAGLNFSEEVLVDTVDQMQTFILSRSPERKLVFIWSSTSDVLLNGRVINKLQLTPVFCILTD